MSIRLSAVAKNVLLRPLSLVALLCLPVLASAQQAEEPQESRWGLGVAALSKQMSITDMDRDNKAFPFISYENQYITVLGPQVSLKLPDYQINDQHQLNFGLSVDYDFGGYDDDDIRDTPILHGMDEGKGGFWAGAQMNWSNPWADVSLQWLSDVSNNSKGKRLKLGIERNWFFGEKIMLTPSLTASWLDDKDVNYHYGVEAHEARVGRPAYYADSTINITYGVRGIYMFNQAHSLMLDLSVTSLGSEIKNSPLVDSSTESTLVFAYIYNF